MGIKRKARGLALPTLFYFIVVVIPIMMVVSKMVMQAQKGALSDTKRRANLGAATSVFMDFMRQFSNSVNDGHYNGLTRAALNTAKSLGTVTATADENNHTVFIQATGAFGNDTTAKQTLSCLVRFESDLLRFGTNVDELNITASNVTYQQGFLSRGDLTVTGNNITFNGGPVIVAGDFKVEPGKTATINGDLYVGGKTTLTGATLIHTGTKFGFAPSFQKPTLDLAYYKTYATWKSTTTTAIWFDATASSRTYQICQWDGAISRAYNCGTPIHISTETAIFYGEHCNLAIGGTVGRRITVVAGGDKGTDAEGNVIVFNDLLYWPNPTTNHTASTTSAVAVLATNRIYLQKDKANLTDYIVHGAMYQESTPNMYLKGAYNKNFTFYGVRVCYTTNQPAWDDPNASFSAAGKTKTYNYDPGLRKYPPPALPERAYMINMQYDPQ